MQLWSLAGNTQKLDGGAMFGNAPRAMWSRRIEPDEHNRIPLACRCLLARDLDGKNVLFGTGIGVSFVPGPDALLLADGQERGVHLFFTHDAECASARVGQDERGRHVPADEQAALVGVEC